jgi:hypothetical protein
MEHNSNYGERTDSEGHVGQGFPIGENKDRKEMGTIDSTVRTMQRVKSGMLTEEDLNQCLEVNARNIGMSVEELKEKAEAQLSQLEKDQETN